MSRRKPRRLHRQVATVAIALVLWFALSGLLLNHARDFGFDQQPLPAALAQTLYGAHLPARLPAVNLADTWIVAVADTLYVGTDALSACPGGLRGALALGPFRAVACADAVHLLDDSGNRVERIGAAWGLNGDITALAQAGDGTLIVLTDHGALCADAEVTALSACTAPTATPALVTAELPAANRAALAQALAPPEVDIERLVHDLHSGRLFGPLARWVWDLFALTLLVLAGSGWWLLRKKH